MVWSLFHISFAFSKLSLENYNLSKFKKKIYPYTVDEIFLHIWTNVFIIMIIII